jgi:hypothetical protein
VSVNTHKRFTLEILMTMAPILDEGVPSLSFHLEGVEQVVPYEYIRELLGFQKGAPKQVDVHEGTWKVFGVSSREKTINEEILSGTPSSKCFTHMCKRILENERNKGNRHGVELALLNFDCQAAN